ncbi:MAG: hypothetical protein K0Q48_1393 [Bacillota bacterium]|nr:hypothetical protein [Bacillota bacterium]
MAKKSNKTEHVLKLITKNDDADQDDLFGLPQELAEKGNNAPTSKPDEPPKVEKPKRGKAAVMMPTPEVTEEVPKAAEPEPEVEPEASEPAAEERQPSAVLEKRGRLINLAEVLVKEKIGLVMEKMKVCTCQTCVSDITALTLNSLPAKYVTADKGKQSIQLDTYKKQYETDILAALTKSCVRVKASPRHVKE